MIPGDWLGDWSAGLLRATWQGAAVILFVALLTRLAPALPPAWRCWLWRGACAKLLLSLGVAGAVALPLLPAREPEAHRGASPAAAFPPVDRADVHPQAPVIAAAETRASDAPAPPPLVVLFALWSLGTVSFAARLVRDHARVASLRRRAAPVEDPGVLDACRALCGRLRVARVPRVLASGETGTPLLVGAVRPVIVLPAASLSSAEADGPAGPRARREGERERLRMMLAHELAHLKRRDLPWNWVPAASLVLFWFHPLAWLACRELRLAQESACDALAMGATGAAPRSYGAMLLDAVAAARSPCRLPRTAAAAVVGTRSSVERRLAAMKQFPTGPSSRGARAALCLFAAAFALAALVPWKLVAQAPGGADGAAPPRDQREGTPRDPQEGAPPPGGAAGAADYPVAGGDPAVGGYPGAGGYPVYGRLAGPPGAGPGYGNANAVPDPFMSEDVVQARGFVAAPEYPLSGTPGAIVSEVPAKQGRRVKKGELLVRLDDAALRAELTAAEARLMTGQVEVRRAHELLERRNATAAEVQVAETQLKGLEAQLELARHKLQRTRVVSPVDGVVSDLPARVGGAAREGQPLAVVLAVDDLSFTMDVDARTLPRLKEGQEVMVRADALPGETFDAVLTFISPQVNPGSGTAQVHAKFKEAADKLRPGLAGTAGIKAPRPQ